MVLHLSDGADHYAHSTSLKHHPTSFVAEDLLDGRHYEERELEMIGSHQELFNSSPPTCSPMQKEPSLKRDILLIDKAVDVVIHCADAGDGAVHLQVGPLLQYSVSIMDLVASTLILLLTIYRGF